MKMNGVVSKLLDLARRCRNSMAFRLHQRGSHIGDREESRPLLEAHRQTMLVQRIEDEVLRSQVPPGWMAGQ